MSDEPDTPVEETEPDTGAETAENEPEADAEQSEGPIGVIIEGGE